MLNLTLTMHPELLFGPKELLHSGKDREIEFQEIKIGIFQEVKSFFFVVVELWSQLADKLTIHSIPCSWILQADHYQSPPSHLRDYSTCNNARLEFSTYFVPSFDPNESCLKNGLHSGL